MSLRGSALKSVVEDLFQVVKDRSTGDEIVFVCPQPGCGDNSGNRSVNLTSGQTNCFRCNKGGDFVKWARWLGYTVDEKGAAQQFVPLEQINFNPETARTDVMPVVASVPLPDGFTYCHDRPKHVYTQLIAEMAEQKNLTIEDLMAAKVGFTTVDTLWEPFAIFPCFEWGYTVYYQGRTYDDPQDGRTKKFPSRRECPFGAKYWIYGIDELRASKCKVAIVVESILNVLSLRKYMREHKLTGAVPVCVFKHYISAPQARKLMREAHLREICLLYDHDATASSWEKAPLIADRIKVTVAEMPPGPGGKKNDPNDDPETAWQVFLQRKVSDAATTLAAQIRGDFSDHALQSEKPGLYVPPDHPLDSLCL